MLNAVKIKTNLQLEIFIDALPFQISQTFPFYPWFPRRVLLNINCHGSKYRLFYYHHLQFGKNITNRFLTRMTHKQSLKQLPDFQQHLFDFVHDFTSFFSFPTFSLKSKVSTKTGSVFYVMILHTNCFPQAKDKSSSKFTNNPDSEILINRNLSYLLEKLRPLYIPIAIFCFVSLIFKCFHDFFTVSSC